MSQDDEMACQHDWGSLSSDPQTEGIVEKIFSYLPPNEVITTVRKVSRKWCEVSRSFTLWEKILQRICVEDGLFLPSYSPERMERVKHFEFAVMARIRFLYMMNNDDPSPESHQLSGQLCIKFGAIVPRLRDRGKFVKPSYMHSFKKVKQMYLVPGGRYLVTEHLQTEVSISSQPNRKSSYLCVWDVGWLTMKLKNSALTPVAVLENHIPVSSTPVHPTSDGMELLLFSKEPDGLNGNMGDESRRETFHVTRFSGQSPMHMTTETSRNEETIPFHVPAENPDLKHCYPVGQLSIDVRNDPKVRFSFDHMVITLSNTHICLWNFVSNEKVIWTADTLDDRDQIKAINLINDYVIVIRTRDLLIWKKPNLYPLVNPLSNDRSLRLTPIRTIPFNEPLHPVSRNVLPCLEVHQMDNWYTNPGHPIYFDVFPDLYLLPIVYTHRVPRIVRHKLDIPSPPANPDFQLTKTASFTYPLPQWTVSPSRIYQGKVFSSRAHKAKFVAHLHDPDSSVNDSSEVPAENICLLEMDDPGRHLYAVCPSSGRIIAAEPVSGSDELELLDLLPHPRLDQYYCKIRLDNNNIHTVD